MADGGEQVCYLESRGAPGPDDAVARDGSSMPWALRSVIAAVTQEPVIDPGAAEFEGYWGEARAENLEDAVRRAEAAARRAEADRARREAAEERARKKAEEDARKAKEEEERERTRPYNRLVMYSDPVDMRRLRPKESAVFPRPRPGEVPSQRWDGGSSLWGEEGFEEAMKRMDRYVKTWDYGKGAENAFDDRGAAPSVVSEDFVLSTEHLNVKKARAFVRRGRDKRSRFLSRTNSEEWRQAVRAESEGGPDLYRWTMMMLVDYRMMVEIREIDYTEMSSKFPDLVAKDKESDTDETPLARVRNWETHEIEKHRARKRAGRRAAEKAIAEERFTDMPSESDAWTRLRTRVEGALPWGRVVLHHSTLSALHYYQVSATVRIMLSGVRERKPRSDPMLETSWGQAAWSVVLATSTPTTTYTYYRDPKEAVQDTALKPATLAKDKSRYWKSIVTANVGDARRRHEHKIPCDVMVERQGAPEHLFWVPTKATKAKVCMQVMLRMVVPWTDERGNLQHTELEFEMMPDDVEERRRPGRAKGMRTPFNCSDPFCDGVVSLNDRCMYIPLERARWYDDDAKVKVDVSTTLVHDLSFPFSWDRSMVKAQIQSRPHRQHVDAYGETVKELAMTNVAFVCSTQTLKHALIQLLEHERRKLVAPAEMETLRSAGVFLERTK